MGAFLIAIPELTHGINSAILFELSISEESMKQTIATFIMIMLFIAGPANAIVPQDWSCDFQGSELSLGATSVRVNSVSNKLRIDLYKGDKFIDGDWVVSQSPNRPGAIEGTTYEGNKVSLFLVEPEPNQNATVAWWHPDKGLSAINYAILLCHSLAH